MLDTHLTSPVTRLRLRSGPVASHIDGFADWLNGCGYRPGTLNATLRSLAGWNDWMRSAGFGADDLPAGLDACAVALTEQPRVRHSRGPNRMSLEAARLFLRFLREQCVLPPAAVAPSPIERWPLLGEFRAWARQHRGLAETSIDTYQPILAELLAAVGDDPRTYTAEALRSFVLERARRHRIERAKTVVVATRSFLRFLGATGRCSPGMEHAIPGFASWQLSSVPRFLAVEDVERVIASCSINGYRPRDRAVLLLLARLGLRASEAAGLKFADIDWRSGRLAVCGKGRRQEWLPLPQEVGAAILAYLRHDRPPLPTPVCSSRP